MKPGRQLRHRNRRIAAGRCAWPAGALVACESLERRHRGWDVAWFDSNPIKGWERPAGFYAWRSIDRDPGTSVWVEGVQTWKPRRELYGTDANAVARQLAVEP